MSVLVPRLKLHQVKSPQQPSKEQGSGFEEGSLQPFSCRQSRSNLTKTKERIESGHQSVKKPATKLPDIYQPRYFRKLQDPQQLTTLNTTRTQINECADPHSKAMNMRHSIALPQLEMDVEQVRAEHRNFRRFIRKVLSRRRDITQRTDSNEAANQLESSSPRFNTNVQPTQDDNSAQRIFSLDISRINYYQDPRAPTPDSLKLIDW